MTYKVRCAIPVKRLDAVVTDKQGEKKYEAIHENKKDTGQNLKDFIVKRWKKI